MPTRSAFPRSLSSWSRSRALATVAAAGLLGACALQDLTDPPNWDLGLNIPAKSTTIAVSTMLPTGVSMSSDNAAFIVSVSSANVMRTLAQVCTDCGPLNGLSAAKPAFNFSANTTTALPSDVTTATLASGTLAIAIQNGFGFDPLGAAGAMVITVTDANNRQLAKDSISGAGVIPASSTINRTMTLAAGSLRGPLTITATVNSPAGAAVTINTAQQITVTGTPQNIRIADATVAVSNKTISTSATELDLSDIDSAIRDRLLGGKLLLAINNPFAVSGNLSLRLQGGSANILKSLALTGGISSPSIEFTQSEIRALMGNKINLTISGPVNSAAPISVNPSQQVKVDTRMELTVSTESK
ncbi:MAG: hypothetical protein K2X99_09625 [Gemmatimonadaceae bacterium]|nr:hypothetical protein [Gemmatimonadaceae bacterium]